MEKTGHLNYQSALLNLAKMDHADLSADLNKLVETASKTMEVERVSIWFFNDPRTEIVCFTLYKKTEQSFESGFKIHASEYPRYFQAIENNRILPAHEAQTDPRTSEFTENYLKAFGITSMMDVAIRLHGKVLGVVCHEHTGKSRIWTDEEQSFAASISDYVSLAIEAAERLKVTQELEKSLSLLAATLESTADGILVVDSSGKIVRYNQKFAKLWKVPQSLLDSQDDNAALNFVLGQLKNPEDFLSKVRELYNQPDAESYDVLFFKDGRIFERFSQPQQIAKKSIGRVWSFRDITGEWHAKEALKQKTEELERSNRELEQFAYIASHDLQEPVHKILALTRALQERAAAIADIECQEWLDWIRKSARRMTQMISNLLQISKVTTHGKPFEPVNLRMTLEGVISDLDLRIKEKKGKVDIGPLPTIWADAAQMNQLFLNLMMNALKFSKKTDPPRIAIRSHLLKGKDDEQVQITLEDNGIGIEEKYLDQIFSPFSRLHSESEYEGTGMGLAICRTIVNRHGGTITAFSTPNKGTTFVMTLPVSPSL